MNKTIVLSVGHNPRSRGARVGDTWEYTLNSLVVLRLREYLEIHGVKVIAVDSTMSLTERIAWLNSQEELRDAPKIEFHHNVFNGKAEGSEIFFRAGDKLGFDLGKKLLGATCWSTGLKNRGLKLATQSARGSLAWTTQLSFGILWEVCFMDNPLDMTKSESFPELLGDAILEVWFSSQPS